MEGSGSVFFNFEQPTISVLIPAYNASAFLHRAVRSALGQTRAPLEVLIIDDLDVNSGPAGARNAGLDAAKGDWVAVLDADDAYTSSRLQTLTSAHAGKNIDIVLGNLLFFDAKNGSVKLPGLPPSDVIESIDLYKFAEHARPYGDQIDWGLLKPMLRREFINAHRLRYPEFSRHGEDFLFMFQVLRSGARCILVRTPDYLYTTRDSGMSRTAIDYDMMITHTLNLLDDPGVAADVHLSRLIRKRVMEAKQWSAEVRLREARNKRDYVQIAFLIATNRGIAIRGLKRFLESLTFRNAV